MNGLIDLDDSAYGWAIHVRGGPISGDGLNIDDVRYLLRRLPALRLWLGKGPGQDVKPEQIVDLPNGTTIVAEIICVACGVRAPEEPVPTEIVVGTEEHVQKLIDQLALFEASKAKAMRFNAAEQVNAMRAIFKATFGAPGARPFVAALGELVQEINLSDPADQSAQSDQDQASSQQSQQPSNEVVTWSDPPPPQRQRRKPLPPSGDNTNQTASAA
jgi:hypothetical protein